MTEFIKYERKEWDKKFNNVNGEEISRKHQWQEIEDLCPKCGGRVAVTNHRAFQVYGQERPVACFNELEIGGPCGWLGSYVIG